MSRKPLIESAIAQEFIHPNKGNEEIVSKINPSTQNIEVDTVSEFEAKRQKKTGTKRITVDLPEDLHREFKKLAVELDTDMNALLNRVVEKMVASRVSNN